MNVAVVTPAVTTTLAGTVAAAVLLLNSVTVRCAAVPAAGAFKVIVDVEFPDPPTTLFGLSASKATPASGVTARGVLFVPPLNVPDMFALALVVTV